MHFLADTRAAPSARPPTCLAGAVEAPGVFHCDASAVEHNVRFVGPAPGGGGQTEAEAGSTMAVSASSQDCEETICRWPGHRGLSPAALRVAPARSPSGGMASR